MNEFLWGALAACSLVVSAFFLKFFAHTRERLFGIFSAAFLVLGMNWTLLAVLDAHDESRHFVYFFRLAAFVLIIVGVIDKNRRRT